MTEYQEIAILLSRITDTAKEMKLTFSKETRPTLSIANTLNLTKAKANRYIDAIDYNVEKLNFRFSKGLIEESKWSVNMLAYQILLYSIVDYVKDRELLGWHITKNFKVR